MDEKTSIFALKRGRKNNRIEISKHLMCEKKDLEFDSPGYGSVFRKKNNVSVEETIQLISFRSILASKFKRKNLKCFVLRNIVISVSNKT